MIDQTTPEAIVQRQLDAYNARDLDALLATYAPDARQYVHPDTLVATGHDAIRARLAPRLQEPNLHARLIQRLVMDTLVIDYEEVRRNFPEGPGSVELVAIYEVADGRIQSQIVKLGKQRVDAPSA